MAGEWIKLDCSTPEKPEVFKIARILGIDADAVVGKLMRLWAWIDTVSVDGVVDGVVDADVDRICRADGFARACASVGWLLVDAANERVSLPNFDNHNGETAKQRALKNRRQAKWRASSSTDASTSSSTSASTREEKRREEEKKELVAEVLIPLDDGSEHPLTAAEISEYRSAYTRIDVLAELRKARAWCVSNPSNRKTRRGVGKFVNGWLSRANDEAAKRAPQPVRQRQQL